MYESIPENSQRSRYDAQIKKVLAYKIPMAHVMALACKEYEGMTTEEITKLISRGCAQAKLLQTEYLYNGKIVYDLLIETNEKNKKYFDTEPERKYISWKKLSARSDVYAATQIVRQYGIDYEKKQYQKLADSYSCWLQFRKNKPRVMRKRMDHLHKVFIYIRDYYDRDEQNEHLRFLSLLFDTDMLKNVKIRILKEEFGINDDLAREVNTMCKISLDILEDGMKKGEKKQIAKTIDAMLADHVRIDLIAKYANVSEEYVRRYMRSRNISTVHC